MQLSGKRGGEDKIKTGKRKGKEDAEEGERNNWQPPLAIFSCHGINLHICVREP